MVHPIPASSLQRVLPWRRSKRKKERQAHRDLILSIRDLIAQLGAPITKEELFAYDNGHFLANQEYQRSKRYIQFNVDELYNTAAAVSGNRSQVTAIDKIEGGFSKAFSMKKEDKSEVIAKIPCRIASPPTLMTAGEVGALEYTTVCWYNPDSSG